MNPAVVGRMIVESQMQLLTPELQRAERFDSVILDGTNIGQTQNYTSPEHMPKGSGSQQQR
jgi:hypothetical protein